MYFLFSVFSSFVPSFLLTELKGTIDSNKVMNFNADLDTKLHRDNLRCHVKHSIKFFASQLVNVENSHSQYYSLQHYSLTIVPRKSQEPSIT